MSMDRIIREEARLVILRALADEKNYSLNEAILAATLETFGISRPRDWLRDEIRWLASMGAVTVTEAGSVLIPTLTNKGRDHVERRLTIEGVKRMGPRE